MGKYFRDPVSGLTHLFGAVASVVGLIVLIVNALNIDYEKYLKLSSAITFGVSLILLYTASAIYHLVKSSDRVIKALRKVDHSMIYILIAGTYTPICLLVLKGNLGIGFLIGIWTLAIIGIVYKLCFTNWSRWFSTALYLIMGWAAVFAIVPIAKVLSIDGVAWLLIGGVSYTIGGVMYGLKRPKLFNKFGFHEAFHICVLIGSFSHYWLVLKYCIM